ncbi:MAG: hypothetical protein A2506_06425 [Elusimicrobia bacterium RIFOXYD12_FULL_66_9]|nr:MAG: hypothetical protein A2506_06425 [Elusimicrobia bacterium RIFOXYD12_FULL_66_9]
MANHLALKIPSAIFMIAAVGLTGCIASGPTRDPFKALESVATNPPLKDLTVGVVISSKSKMTLEHLDKLTRDGLGVIGFKDASQAFQPTIGVLKRNFSATDRFDSLDAAVGAKVDIAAVLDIAVAHGSGSGQYTVADVSVDFYDREKRLIESLNGQGRRRIPWPASMMIAEAAGDAAEAFAVRLATAPALARYALGLGKAAPAVARSVPTEPVHTYQSDVEVPAFKLPEDPNKFALVIGIESYSDVPAAQFAVRDADAVKRHLLALGYPERNVILLTDQRAGKSAIEKNIEVWLPRNTDENSNVFIYFSGHGAPDPATGRAYLVPWDADAKYIDSTGYAVSRLYEKLNALKAKKVLLAMDACFSGAGGRSVLAAGTRPLVGRIDTSSGMAGRVGAITAAAADETTGTYPDSGHGLFTYHLLKGLDSKGGKATLRELINYLSPKVRDAARRDNRDQTPQLVGNGNQSL